MKIKGRVTETLIVVKEVEIEISDAEHKDNIEGLVEEEAYKETIDFNNGWEGADTVETNVEWEEVKEVEEK